MFTVLKMESEIKPYIFSEANFKHPDCLKNAKDLKIIECPLVDVKSDSDLEGYGYLLHNGPDDISCEKGNFEIKKWPVQGWRQLDPGTGQGLRQNGCGCVCILYRVGSKEWPP